MFSFEEKVDYVSIGLKSFKYDVMLELVLEKRRTVRSSWRPQVGPSSALKLKKVEVYKPGHGLVTIGKCRGSVNGACYTTKESDETP